MRGSSRGTTVVKQCSRALTRHRIFSLALRYPYQCALLSARLTHSPCALETILIKSLYHLIALRSRKHESTVACSSRAFTQWAARWTGDCSCFQEFLRSQSTTQTPANLANVRCAIGEENFVNNANCAFDEFADLFNAARP